jgi:hypothetical protein
VLFALLQVSTFFAFSALFHFIFSAFAEVTCDQESMLRFLFLAKKLALYWKKEQCRDPFFITMYVCNSTMRQKRQLFKAIFSAKIVSKL